MEPLDFKEIAALINYTRTTSIALPAAEGKKDAWDIYLAEHRVHTARWAFVVVHLHSDATRRDIEALFDTSASTTVVSSAIRTKTPIHLLYTERVKQRIPRLDDLLQSLPVESYTLRDYLFSFIKEETGRYRENLRKIAPQNYIDPHVEVPQGATRVRPSPLSSFMVDADPRLDGNVAVLLADPGQGKTFAASQLAASLFSQALVPIYVDSRQWAALASDELASLSKTIVNSFRYFEAPIPWIDEHEDEFLRITLKARIFRIIFDGFDEYVFWNKGAVTAADTLKGICALASATDARVAITSRTSFWESDVRASRETHPELHVYSLRPFTREHAEAYFNKRLSASAPRDALNIYLALQREEPELVGRGFVLNLIASAVEAGSTGNMISKAGELTALEWLIQAFCDREKERHKLALDGHHQVAGLRYFAAEMHSGQAPTNDLFDYCQRVANPDIDDRALGDAIAKMRLHPLLGYDASADRWSFRHDQIDLALLAGQFLECLDRQAELVSLLQQLRLAGTSGADLADMIAELAIGRGRTSRGYPDRMASALAGALRELTPDAIRSTSARGLPAAVALALVDKTCPRGTQHRERLDRLRTALPAGELRSLVFLGSFMPLSRFDFRGATFLDCRFENQELTNCDFDSETVFRQCSFVGGATQYCRGIGLARFEHCTFDDAARAWLSRHQVADGRRVYSRSDLLEDIRSVMRKFISRGGLSLRTIEIDVLTRGPISVSPHRDAIIDELFGHVLLHHAISGVSGGGVHVREEAAESVKFFATNNVLSGILEAVANRLVERLALTID